MLILSERRIILIGKIGVGKSHSGNAILNEQYFQTSDGWRSVTNEVSFGTATRGGISYQVYDTPGALSSMDKKTFPKEVLNCLLYTAPGFHCLTLVIPTNVCVTKEELEFYDTLERALGPGYENHLMIIFTKCGSIDEVNELLESACEGIKRIVRKVNERYVCFGDNKWDVDRKLVDIYLTKLNEMVDENIQNGREHYRHKLYTKVQEFLDREAAIIMEKEKLSLDEAFHLARERARHDEISILKFKTISFCAIL